MLVCKKEPISLPVAFAHMPPNAARWTWLTQTICFTHLANRIIRRRVELPLAYGLNSYPRWYIKFAFLKLDWSTHLLKQMYYIDVSSTWHHQRLPHAPEVFLHRVVEPSIASVLRMHCTKFMAKMVRKTGVIPPSKKHANKFWPFRLACRPLRPRQKTVSIIAFSNVIGCNFKMK